MRASEERLLWCRRRDAGEERLAQLLAESVMRRASTPGRSGSPARRWPDRAVIAIPIGCGQRTRLDDGMRSRSRLVARRDGQHLRATAIAPDESVACPVACPNFAMACPLRTVSRRHVRVEPEAGFRRPILRRERRSPGRVDGVVAAVNGSMNKVPHKGRESVMTIVVRAIGRYRPAGAARGGQTLADLSSGPRLAARMAASVRRLGVACASRGDMRMPSSWPGSRATAAARAARVLM